MDLASGWSNTACANVFTRGHDDFGHRHEARDMVGAVSLPAAAEVLSGTLSDLAARDEHDVVQAVERGGEVAGSEI